MSRKKSYLIMVFGLLLLISACSNEVNKKNAHEETEKQESIQEKLAREGKTYNINAKYVTKEELLERDKADGWDDDFWAEPRYSGRYEPEIGMTPEEAEKSTWGKPNKRNKTTTASGVREQWVYYSTRYLYFEDGYLTTIQE